MCRCSYTDEITPVELQKILQHVEENIARVERKLQVTSGGNPVGNKRKTSVSNEKSEAITLVEKYMVQDYKRIKNQWYNNKFILSTL